MHKLCPGAPASEWHRQVLTEPSREGIPLRWFSQVRLVDTWLTFENSSNTLKVPGQAYHS